MLTRKMRAYVAVALLFFSLMATWLLGACTTSSSGAQTNTAALPPAQTRNFTLYVRDTTLTLPGGKKIYSFGYTDDPKGQAKIPGPTLVVNQGDTVNLTLMDDKDPTKTASNPTGDGHTIHLHGLDLPSVMDGDPMTAPGGTAVMQGKSYTYHFVADQPGTYWYHCHQGAAEHIQMGMYGAFIILPRGDAHRAYPNTPTFDKQYTLVLSDMDSSIHDADHASLMAANPAAAQEPNWTQYKPDYFFINGNVWPAIIRDPNSFIMGTVGQRILIRLINTGYVVHSMHLHGFHFQVIGTDGRALPAPYLKDTVTIGSAERYDILVTLDKPGRYMLHDHVEINNTNAGHYPGGIITFVNSYNKDGSNPVPESQLLMGGDGDNT